MRLSKATAFLMLAGTCGGCSRQEQIELQREVARVTYMEQLGPIVVASIVGTAGPVSGPAGLSPLCTDQAWRMLIASETGDRGYGPSVFEVPDPNRRFKIGPITRSTPVLPPPGPPPLSAWVVAGRCLIGAAVLWIIYPAVLYRRRGRTFHRIRGWTLHRVPMWTLFVFLGLAIPGALMLLL
jgi:hypothetical protein